MNGKVQWGTITSTSPLKVAARGSTTGMPATRLTNTTYTPTIGDLVLYVLAEKLIVILGKPA